MVRIAAAQVIRSLAMTVRSSLPCNTGEFRTLLELAETTESDEEGGASHEHPSGLTAHIALMESLVATCVLPWPVTSPEEQLLDARLNVCRQLLHKSITLVQSAAQSSDFTPLLTPESNSMRLRLVRALCVLTVSVRLIDSETTQSKRILYQVFNVIIFVQHSKYFSLTI